MESDYSIFVSSSEVAGDRKSSRTKPGPETWSSNIYVLMQINWSSLNRGPKAESLFPLSKPLWNQSWIMHKQDKFHISFFFPPVSSQEDTDVKQAL